MTDLEALKTQFKLIPSKKPIELPEQYLSGSFSPCGAFFLAGGMMGQVGRWTVIPDTPETDVIALQQLTGLTSWVSACRCLPDGKHVVAADSFGQLACWSYCDDRSEPVWKVPAAHSSWIRDITIAPNGQTIVTAGRDGRVVFWSLDGKQQSEINVGGDLYVVRFAPDGRSLFVGVFGKKLTQWDVTNRTRIREFDVSPLFTTSRLQDVGGVRAMAISPDGSTLLAGGTQPANGGNVQGKPTILAFDVASGELKKKAELGADGDVYVTDIEWHTDGCWLITTSGNPGQGKFLCWRPQDEQPLFETKLSNCHAVRVHPSGRWLGLITTNSGSNGNGRQLDKNGEYPGNRSPLAVMSFPAPALTEPATGKS